MPSPLPITASTVCCALGDTRAQLLDALLAGRSGLRAPSMALPFQTAVGEIAGDFEPLPSDLHAWDTRQTRLAAHLLRDLTPDLARVRARWGDKRIGLFIGTSTAGILHSEAAHAAWLETGKLPVDYDFAKQHAYDGVLTVLRHLTGIAGPGYVVSTACSSSAKVLAAAKRLIEADIIDAAVVGGIDTLCQTTLRGFHGLGVLSQTPCRPFGAGRDGISIGEGGALLLVERQGDARALLLSVGESSDAHHVSAPHPEGIGAELAMQFALDLAGLQPDAVGHINAHGTATPLNDAAEGAAISRLFGSDVPVISTKGYVGHLLGAAGAIEAVIGMLVLEEGFIPASLGVTPQDPEIAIHVPAQLLRQRCTTVLSNSFAFGGNNTCVALGAP